MRNEHNIKGIVFMEAIIKPFIWDSLTEDLVIFFKSLRHPELGRELVINQNLFIEKVLYGNIGHVLTEEEFNFYRMPFNDPASRKPLLRWPNEVPIEGEPKDVTEAVDSYCEKLQKSDLPKLMFYSTPGALTTEEILVWCFFSGFHIFLQFEQKSD